MAVMTGGLLLFARLGGGTGFGSLMPGFVLFGAGTGLMFAPVTNAIMESAPPAQAGIASALLNASREVAGLLGITVIGAVLRSREAASLRGGASAAQSFLDGYHTGLWVTIVLLAAGVPLSYLTLRHRAGDAAGAPGAVTAEPAALGEILAEEVYGIRLGGPEAGHGLG